MSFPGCKYKSLRLVNMLLPLVITIYNKTRALQSQVKSEHKVSSKNDEQVSDIKVDVCRSF